MLRLTVSLTTALLVIAGPAMARGGGRGGGGGGGARGGGARATAPRPTVKPGYLPRPGTRAVGPGNRGGGPGSKAGGSGSKGEGSRPRIDRDSAGRREKLRNRRDELQALRHRDRDGDGQGDRHRQRFRRDLRYIRWYNWSGIYGGGLWWGNPFYDPFYRTGYYQDERDARDENQGAGNIEVNVSPREAEIWVNGVRYGRGKARFSLPSGVWTMELRQPGYLPQILELTVEPGVRYKVDRKLRKDESLEPGGSPRKEVRLDREPALLP